jgi:predicted alpha/beta-fold hydrolase
MSMDLDVPAFHPPFWLRNGHAQTLAALALVGPQTSFNAMRHRVALPDGDAIVLTDDAPQTWKHGERAALLVHGLAGCHESPYMRRIAHKLTTRGVRSFRLDLRGCGAGQSLAQRPYHAGLTSDLRAALQHVEHLCPGSPIAVVGFSLGGNLVLKLLGEATRHPLPNVDRGFVVCPPIDLEFCCRSLTRGLGRWYDRHFVALLMQRQSALQALVAAELPAAATRSRRPRTLFEFDDCYTAPLNGFRDALHYYREASAAAFIPKIEVPTVLLRSDDDPVVPRNSFDRIEWPAAVRVIATRHGGHLGFIASRRARDGDRCWMDWRVVDWVTRAPS